MDDFEIVSTSIPDLARFEDLVVPKIQIPEIFLLISKTKNLLMVRFTDCTSNAVIMMILRKSSKLELQKNFHN